MRGTALLLVLAVSLAGYAGASAEPLLVLFGGDDVDEVPRAIGFVEGVGGVVRHVFPGIGLICECPSGVVAEFGATWRVLADPDAHRAQMRRQHGEAAYQVVRAWQRLADHGVDRSIDQPPANFNDEVSTYDSRQAYCEAAGTGTATGANFCDTSEFLVGTVTLALMFPESDGTVDPSTEDWTSERQTEILSRVVVACDWWIDRASEYGVPLSFTYDLYTDLPTGYEPIAMPYYDERFIWIADCLDGLGIPHGEDNWEQMNAFANSERGTHGTDWAVIAWIVDSLNDEDGEFPDGWYAVSSMGGPYFVITSDVGLWGHEFFEETFAHELAHCFYALDQYYWGTCTCGLESGYLSAANENCDHSCAHDDTASVMRVPWQIPSFADWTVDYYAAGQIGWWDGDSDGMPDVLDTHPGVWLSVLPPDLNVPSALDYSGLAVVDPLPSLNPHGEMNDISVNEIADVKWRVDGASWVPAAPADGSFDSGEESFGFTIDSLSVGVHVVEVTATNNIGNTSLEVARDTVEVVDWVGVPETGIGPMISLHAAFPNPFVAATTIRYTLPRDSRTTVSVHGISGRHVRSLVECQLRHAGEHTEVWDGCDDDGYPVSSGVYFCRLEVGGDVESSKVILLR